MRKNKTSFDQLIELDLQINTLINKGYLDMLNCTKDELLILINPLKEELKKVSKIVKPPDFENGYLPFVLVSPKELISPETLIEKIEKDGKKAVSRMYPHQPSDFFPIDSIQIPEKKFYLLIGISRGKESLNVTPNNALEVILKDKKTPLTIEEGLAIMTHYPEFLIKNNCFSLLGSRIKNNKRVPAIWINSKKQPNLGWCWAGNPHTWLGSASALIRISSK